MYIEDAHIIEEYPKPGSNLGDANGLVEFGIDKLSGSSDKAQWITQGVILAGLAKDNSQLANALKSGRPQLNAWFDQLDYQKISKMVSGPIAKQIKLTMSERIKNNVPGFLVGAFIAATVVSLVKKKSS